MAAPEVIAQAATRLMKAAATHTTCPPVRDLIGETDLEAAYEVQQVVNQAREQRGGKVIGRKIGLTSLAVQKQIGVDQPDYGAMFEDMLVPDGGSLAMADVMQPKAETEIAFVLKADLNEGPYTMEQVTAAVDYAVACIEIAGSRVADWNIRITDTIADNASASHFVLGEQRLTLADFDPAAVSMTMHKNGEEVSSGTGADCMGSPLISLHWLAGAMLKAGTPLRAGDVVLSGALGPMAGAEAGDSITANIDAFDPISVSFH